MYNRVHNRIFYGNAGTVNYAACSFVKTPCWKYFLAFHVSIEKRKKSIASHNSDASVKRGYSDKITEIKRVRYSRYRLYM